MYFPQEYTRNGKKDGVAAETPGHVDLLFLSESCVVSKAAIQLMKLVHQTLKVLGLKFMVIWFSPLNFLEHKK